MNSLLAVAASLTMLVLPASAIAQTDASGPMRQAVIESLQDSQWVQLSASGLGRRQGRLLSRGPSELVLAPDPEPLRVPATSVDTLWTRGTSTMRGALIGAVLGLAVGVAFAATADPGELDTPPEAIWVGSLGIGTVGGGVIGALVGTAIPRWKQRYP
jgi:hypothetical protein